MQRKIIYIILVLCAFNLFTGFNIERIPRWFKGIWDYNDGKYKNAVSQFEQGKNGDKDAVMQYNKGAAQYKDQQWKDSEETFTKAVETDPQFEAAHYNQGNARFQQANYKGAIESYEKALELDPNDEDARHNLELAKKMLEQQNNAGDTADTQPDQQRPNPQKSDRDAQDNKDSGSENLSGKEQENQDSGKQGESSGGNKKEDIQDENSQGGPKDGEPEEDEEQPQNVEKQNTSGLSEEIVKEILEALAQDEKALAGKLDREKQHEGLSSTDPFGVFDELFSIADDLDPFATPKHKKRDKTEIDW